MNQIFIPLELQLRYIQNRKNDLVKCQNALQLKNFEILISIGHQIKGNAISFGFEELGQIAVELEHQANLKDSNKLYIILINLDTYLKSIK